MALPPLAAPAERELTNSPPPPLPSPANGRYQRAGSLDAPAQEDELRRRLDQIFRGRAQSCDVKPVALQDFFSLELIADERQFRAVVELKSRQYNEEDEEIRQLVEVLRLFKNASVLMDAQPGLTSVDAMQRCLTHRALTANGITLERLQRIFKRIEGMLPKIDL